MLTTTKFDRFARKMAEAGDILTGLGNEYSVGRSTIHSIVGGTVRGRNAHAAAFSDSAGG
ncbi:hypothetical protein [Nocardia donostiensis]|uniref:hypothetical protein n=1 Tax=Nocardia donostiensis TaxID=1538463 RepID=UPI001FE62F42|nr:hypothetical protein [Nocardia donostiensis]